MGCWKVFNNVLSRPTSSRHDNRARLQLIELALFQVNDRDKVRLTGLTVMLNVNYGRTKADPRRIICHIKLRKIDPIAADGLDIRLSINRAGYKRLHHKSGNGCITSGEHLVSA